MTYSTFMVLLGTSLLGCVAGVVGCFSVLRRRALIGDVLAHAALPGLCLAYLVVGERHFASLLGGAWLAGVVGVGVISFVCRWTRTKEDAAIGIVLSTFFGFGVVLLSVIQRSAGLSGKAGLNTFIFGQAAAIVRRDVWLIAGISFAVLIVVALLYKEFKLLSFDNDFAQAQGWPVGWLDLVMMGLLTVVTVVGLPAVGVVLMAAMLIIPGAAARFWTDRLGVMLLAAGMIGMIASCVGTLVSAGYLVPTALLPTAAASGRVMGLPTGPLIVLAGAAIFLGSVMFAPGRGVVAQWWSDARLRRRTAEENLLRAMYECNEPVLPRCDDVDLGQLRLQRDWRPGWFNWALRRASARGWIELATAHARLTDAGLHEAARITRLHRLWETFLIKGAHIAPDHVDRDADSIEHFLGVTEVAALEATLAQKHVGRIGADDVPASPHAISTADTQREAGHG
ncbi:MAG: metal ABC transporter permease [Planctomycetales bacterium]|nr:metal ABC transporter permease [Planctomycetales bacterium]